MQQLRALGEGRGFLKVCRPTRYRIVHRHDT
jgi:hypothetical protein